jgi:2-keto-4-pentenoate hydratase/2-oxohepta-3-ene-1,7-dioic acid hydratase in catechol pathway
MDFRLLTYVRQHDGPRAGLFVEGKGVIDIEAILESEALAVDEIRPVSMLNVLDHWEKVYPVLCAVVDDPGAASASSRFFPLSDIRLTAPILYPSNIYCAAANYLDHRKEMGGARLPDKQEARPYFFTKLPRQTVVGTGEAIRIPYPEAKVDWEAEIGVVIGRRCSRVSASEAMAYVAGYVVFNDISDRARLFRGDWHFKFDWFGGKSFDTSAPMGPWITPASLVPDPHRLTLQLWVNDERMQNASSRDMYFTIPEQIEYLSGLITLFPGDVIATGTPEGVGHPRGLYLKPGDTVTTSIEGLGLIKNPVAAGF